MKEIMAELTGETKSLSYGVELLRHLSFLTCSTLCVFVFNKQAEEEELQREKEALCTCTVKTSTEEMGLSELR